MTAVQVEALTRNILLHPRLPFTFLSLSAVPNGWHIAVCDAAGATHSLTVSVGRPLDMRRAIQERLEMAVEDGRR
jgi:hypothetical protein